MRAYRRPALLALAIALTLAGCTSKKVATTPGPSDVPTSTPAAQALADVQLVGRAQHAFVGVGAGIDTTGTPTSTATPLATATASATFDTPGQRGVMRILLDDASDSLKTNCGAARDETINVFWTTQTQFDSALLSSDLESSLEGRTVGVVGRVFMLPESSDTVGETTPTPTASAGTAVNPLCIVLADQIATSTGTIPTAPPSVRRLRTASPRPSATTSPTASPSTSPTTSPSPSASSSPVPTAT